MRPLGRCPVPISAVQSLGVPARRTRVQRRGREYLLLGSMQLAGGVLRDVPRAGTVYSDGGASRDDDGRIAPHDGDP
jgi:hypothetical protein